MPVDSAVFLGQNSFFAFSIVYSTDCLTLDFVPVSHQYLLTVMSIFWSLGQLLASLVGRLVVDIFVSFVLQVF